MPETFVYGGNERIFRIELLDLDLVRSDKLEPQAPARQAEAQQHADARPTARRSDSRRPSAPDGRAAQPR